MFSHLFDRWGKSSRFTSGELFILRALLPSGNRNSEILHAQALFAPYIERKLVGTTGYEALIPYVEGHLPLIDFDEDIESPVLTIKSVTGRTLSFSTTIYRCGFLRGLKGKSEDGQPWPKTWIPDLHQFRLPNEMMSWVPEPMLGREREGIINEILAWCGIAGDGFNKNQRKNLRVTRAATDEDIDACERGVAQTALRLGAVWHKRLVERFLPKWVSLLAF